MIDPKTTQMGNALSGAVRTKIERAYDEGFADGEQQAKRNAAKRQICGAVASVAACLLFDLGQRRGWR